MIRIQTFVTKKTFEKLETQRGEIPMSAYVRKILEVKK